MELKAVFLEPLSTFKSELRSDTLWSTLCWAIRAVHGEGELVKLLHAYEDQDSWDNCFFISSAMRFQAKKGRRSFFLPNPKQRRPLPDSLENKSLEEVRATLRQEKKNKDSGWIEMAMLQHRFGDAALPTEKTVKAKKFEQIAVTHNTINRIRGGTLSLNESGQLYHTEEYAAPSHTSLYFLVSGNDTLLPGALNYLEHMGIGGDASIGKGRFKIHSEVFSYSPPAQPNALLNLSLFHPTESELDQIETAKQPPFYRTVARQGWKMKQSYGEAKRPALFFEEGSVFPLFPEWKEQKQFGRLLDQGRHESGHVVRQYGFGLMLPIQIPEKKLTDEA